MSSFFTRPLYLLTDLRCADVQAAVDKDDTLLLPNHPRLSAVLRALCVSEFALYPIIIEQPAAARIVQRTALGALARVEDILAWYETRRALRGDSAADLEADSLLQKGVGRQLFRCRKWSRIPPPPANPVLSIYAPPKTGRKKRANFSAAVRDIIQCSVALHSLSEGAEQASCSSRKRRRPG